MKQKLSAAQVAEIAARVAMGERQLRLAAEFGVAQSLVSMISRGQRRWLASGKRREVSARREA